MTMDGTPTQGRRLSPVGWLLLLAVALGGALLILGAYIEGGAGWALIAAGILLLAVGLRADLL